MKRVIGIAVCFLLLLSCVLPVQASGGVPKEVMDATKSVVRILSQYYNGSATGSGFVIKNEPGEVLIATNDHVVSGNPYSISVWVSENELVDAEIVFTTSAKDLCVLRVTDPMDMKPLTLSTEEPEHGAAIYVVGYPGAGDILSDTQAHTSDSVTITDGIISAIRTFTIENDADPVKLLQVNAAINSGNSGGPLFNSEGVVIGVNTYKVNANSQGVFGSVDISELWGLLEQHGIEIPAQAIAPEAKEFPVLTVVAVVGTIAVLIAVLIFVKTKKKTKTLRKFMESHPNGLGVSEAVSMLLPVAIQLRDLHNSGKLHLQVSPDSILISAAGAALKEPSKKETDRHAAGFAAPEIYKGTGLGMASDLYSFVAVLYYAATGTVPANSLQFDLLESELALLKETEVAFAEIIRKGMAHLPQDRIQSMQELIYEVSVYNAKKFDIADPPKTEPRKHKAPKEKASPKPKKTVPALAALAIIIAAIALLWKPYIQPQIDARNEAALLEQQYLAAIALMEEGRYAEAIDAFEALTGYKDSTEQSENCRIAMENAVLEEKYLAAEQLAAEGMHAHAGIAFAKLDGYKNARERSFEEWSYTRPRQTIAVGYSFSYAYGPSPYVLSIQKDGTAIMVGNNSKHCESISGWRDLVGVCMVRSIPFGIKSDGTIVSGSVLPGEQDIVLDTKDGALFLTEQTKAWTDIIYLRPLFNSTWGVNGILGLKRDGTVVYAGENEEETKKINERISTWTNIVDLPLDNKIVCLKADGTVVSYEEYISDSVLLTWEDIVSVKCMGNGVYGYKGIYGICADGTVQVAGAEMVYDDGWNWKTLKGKIAGLTDVVDVASFAALKTDQTVSLFSLDFVEHSADFGWLDPVKNWENIIALYGNEYALYGLKADGSVVAVGQNLDWTHNVSDWTDVAHIVTGNTVVGIKKDGSLVDTVRGKTDIEKITNIRLP